MISTINCGLYSDANTNPEILSSILAFKVAKAEYKKWKT